MSANDERHVLLEASHNFRDLGGYRTRDGQTVAWRRVFRADGLYRLTDDDLDVVAGLGIRTVVDLRTEDEERERGRFPVERHDVNWHRLSIVDKTWNVEDAPGDHEDPAHFLARMSLLMIEERPEEIRQVFSIMADPANLPLVFHCAAGKDRTGIIAMILLGVLGVPEATIAEDYSLSEPAMERLTAWFRDNMPEAITSVTSVMENPPRAFVSAPAAVVPLVFAEMRARHGSSEGLLHDLGVTAAEIASLRLHLLV